MRASGKDLTQRVRMELTRRGALASRVCRREVCSRRVPSRMGRVRQRVRAFKQEAGGALSNDVAIKTECVGLDFLLLFT